MECSKCHQNSIIFQPYSGQALCGRHFVADVETKVKRVIRQHQWLKPGDHIGVLLFGNQENGALLYFLKALTNKRRDIRISPFPTDTGRIADIARDNGFTGVAAGYTLDDFSGSVLATLLSGCHDWESRQADLGNGLFRWIFPFMAVSAREIALYARLCGTGCNPGCCSPDQDTFHNDVMTLLSEYTEHHPATAYALKTFGENLSESCDAGEMYFLSPELFQKRCRVEPPEGAGL